MESDVRVYTAKEREEIRRFIQALGQAQVVQGGSQRELAASLGITIGTLSKYLKGTVPPGRVGFAIQCALAKVLGVTPQALAAWYERGEYATEVSLDDVESWVRSESGQKDLPKLMDALREAGERLLCGDQRPAAVSQKPQRYEWPLEALEEVGMSVALRERMGLGDEALRALVEEGVYDEALVEAFAVACGYETEAVAEAFASRAPVQ